MALPSYQLKVYNITTGDLMKVYDPAGFHTMRYSRALNGVGSLVVVFDSIDGLLDTFPLDTLIDVERTSPVTGDLAREETFLVRMWHRFREGDTERLIIGGQSLNHLLARRIIDPDDDPLAAGGYSTKSGAADAIMREYALEQAGASASAERQFPNLTVNTVSGSAQNAGRRLRHETLLEIMTDLGDQGGTDFIIDRTSANNLALTIAPIGDDLTKSRNYPFAPFVLINPLRGNIIDPSLKSERKDEQNFIYALGKGPGESRIVLKQAGDGVGDSPLNRVEFTKDVRVPERGNTLQIQTEMKDALAEVAAETELTFNLSGHEVGSVYRLNWEVGDKITAQWDTVDVDVRVTGVEIDISASGENLSVTTEAI